MAHLWLNLFCAGYAIGFCASFLCFDYLLRMESQVPEDQRHQGGRVIGVFSLAREMTGSYPHWVDIKAVLLGLRLYVMWIFRTPQWLRSDLRARRALWAMRSLFWLCIIGAYIVKETLL